MIFRISKSVILLGLIVCAFLACTNSDDYLFNEQDLQEIEVSAVITNSFENDAEKKKTDTIQPGDSLIFLTTVQPSKSIRNRQYYWTMDGSNFASEYSFKKNINDPGIHKIAFVFIDFFGDTLSDTITITVASSPIIDTEKFIPANKTQNIDPDSTIHFAWNSYDPDSLWETFFRFVLQNSEQDTLIDTLLHQANFSSHKKLSPLQKYTWTVTAYNEFNQESKESLSASFFTEGRDGENGVSGIIGSNSNLDKQDFKLILLDSIQTPLDTLHLTRNDHFNINPLAKGKYSLIASVEDATDFRPDTIQFHLGANQILELDSIILRDITPPRIQTLTGSDTLDLSDTLRFIVYDLGGPIPESKISVYYENQYLENVTLSKDTLYIPFIKEASAQNWTCKFILINITDASNNKLKQSFYLRPNTTLSEVFGE